MTKGDMEIFTFMALDKRPLDLEMECKRKGGWSAQKEFGIQLNLLLPYLICKWDFTSRFS
jgi:hypothetical protein